MANSGEELLYLERSHGDRYNMDAWHEGNDLVSTVAGSSSCGKKVVVINAPGPINVPWKNSVELILMMVVIISTYNYDEGVFVGQRYFDKNCDNPIFPFGFGLSYTTFTFSGLTTTYDSSNKKLTATFNVKNDGSKDGDVVPMLFLKWIDKVFFNQLK